MSGNDPGGGPFWLLSSGASSVTVSVELSRCGGSQPSIFSSFLVGEICLIVMVTLSQKQWPFSALSFFSSSSLIFLGGLKRKQREEEKHKLKSGWGTRHLYTGDRNFPHTERHSRNSRLFVTEINSGFPPHTCSTS